MPVASSTFDDFDAEASLLALQKHVDAAAANGVTNAQTAVTTEQQQPAQLSTAEAAANSIAYAASSALVAARSTNGNHSQHPNAGALGSSDPEAQIHPDLRSAFSPPPATFATTATMSSAAPPPAAPSAPAASPQQAPALIQAQQQQQQPLTAAPVAPQQSLSPSESHELADVITDGRKGPRRELSTSKRAAQNRAAQVRPLYV